MAINGDLLKIRCTFLSQVFTVRGCYLIHAWFSCPPSVLLLGTRENPEGKAYQIYPHDVFKTIVFAIVHDRELRFAVSLNRARCILIFICMRPGLSVQHGRSDWIDQATPAP